MSKREERLRGDPPKGVGCTAIYHKHGGGRNFSRPRFNYGRGVRSRSSKSPCNMRVILALARREGGRERGREKKKKEESGFEGG